MNADAFNALSNAHQQAVREAAIELAALQRELWEKRAAASREKVVAEGVQFNENPDKSAFQDGMQPVCDNDLAANPDIKPLVEPIQNTG